MRRAEASGSVGIVWRGRRWQVFCVGRGHQAQVGVRGRLGARRVGGETTPGDPRESGDARGAAPPRWLRPRSPPHAAPDVLHVLIMDHLGALHAADRRPSRLASLRQDVAALSQVYASASSTELNSPHPNFLPPRFASRARAARDGGRRLQRRRDRRPERADDAARAPRGGEQGGGRRRRTRQDGGALPQPIGGPPLAARDVRKLDPILGGVAPSRASSCAKVWPAALFLGAASARNSARNSAHTPRAPLLQAASSPARTPRR